MVKIVRFINEFFFIIDMVETELKDRLERLGLRLGTLDDYVFLSRFGYKAEKIIREINGFLGGRFFDEDLALGIWKPESGFPDERKLNIVEGRIDRLYSEVLSDDDYQRFLQAYNSGNQEEIRRVAENVFKVIPCSNGELRRLTLYHGIGMDEVKSLDDYIDLILKIMDKGLQASPYGCHAVMDENIRPIYFTADADCTYGLVFLSTPVPEGYSVFEKMMADSGESERLIYTKGLKVPFELHLKSRRHLARMVGLGIRGNETVLINEVPTNNPDELVKIKTELERKLKNASIKYELAV